MADSVDRAPQEGGLLAILVAVVRRDFGVAAPRCPRCGAGVHLVAAIEDPAVTRRILECRILSLHLEKFFGLCQPIVDSCQSGYQLVCLFHQIFYGSIVFRL